MRCCLRPSGRPSGHRRVAAILARLSAILLLPGGAIGVADAQSSARAPGRTSLPLTALPVAGTTCSVPTAAQSRAAAKRGERVISATVIPGNGDRRLITITVDTLGAPTASVDQVAYQPGVGVSIVDVVTVVFAAGKPTGGVLTRTEMRGGADSLGRNATQSRPLSPRQLDAAMRVAVTAISRCADEVAK